MTRLAGGCPGSRHADDSEIPFYLVRLWQIAIMPGAKRGKTPGSGRRSKGERVQFITRLPIELATRVRAEAEELDLSYSEALANRVAASYGLPPVAVSPAAGQQKLIA